MATSRSLGRFITTATSLTISASANVSGLDISDVQNARYVDALFVRRTAYNNNANRVLRIGDSDTYNSTGRGFVLSVIKRSDHSVLTYQRDGTSSSTQRRISFTMFIVRRERKLTSRCFG